MEFLEDMSVGSRSSRMARANLDESLKESVRQGSDGEEGGPGLHFSFPFTLFLSFVQLRFLLFC